MDNCGDLPCLCGYTKVIGVKSEKGKGVVMVSMHSFSLLIHKLQEVKRRGEQGLLPLCTQKLSGYYDYLYIHNSRCETNLSLNRGRV